MIQEELVMADCSIVFVDAAGTCAGCGRATGQGPVGWCGGGPLCDGCLIERSPHLGMVLHVALLFREVGGIDPRERSAVDLAYQVLSLARIYEGAASGVWSARRAGMRELVRRWGGEVNELRVGSV